MDAYLGEIKMFAGTYAPSGWAFCDGRLVSISDNDALFTLIGTTYGGDGQTTFALPDLRGRVPIHRGTAPSLGSYSIGETGGVEQVLLTGQNLPAHSHTVVASKNKGTTTNPTNNVLAVADPACKVYVEAKGNLTFAAGQVLPPVAGNVPHENRQPYVALNFIIAMAGTYPQQG